MHGPGVVSWLLVAICGAVGAYCLTRVRQGSAGQRRISGIEAAMGLGMAAMALPGETVVSPLLLAVLFGATALSALSLLLHGAARSSGPHFLHHVLEALAMLYMALVMQAAAGSGGGHAAHSAGPGGVPALTGALLLYFGVYALRAGTRLVPAAASGTAGDSAAVPLPATADACRLALALGSFAMLLGM
ncbi:DUF5134 domain-containing protein [Streptomyces sp. N2-109]|uniref:DUF5134 domain-containing protein n=1 Tax=Streptomyces gossypii TaxID=2883101 RepID=A0ABT2JVN3_9ACTN|nr:DUF5134 domain-containing protein [Streptomyces gossypii]MCT2591385.1 DUF5134 domain-containing protein [Streptomyces gossypii]